MAIAVLIHKDPESVYGVTVPALPGCFSWGDTIDDAIENAREAVHAHLSEMISEGMPISLTQAAAQDSAADAAEADGVWVMVAIEISDFESALAGVR